MRKVRASLALVALFAAQAAVSQDIEPGHTAMWFDPDRSGEGWVLEVLDEDRALMYWFTFDEEGNQRWLMDDGVIDGNRIVFDEMHITAGGRLGHTDPDAVERPVVGQAVMTFDGCDTGAIEYEAFGQSQTIEFERLTRTSGLACGGNDNATDDPRAGLTGSWFDPEHAGEGFIFQWLDRGEAMLVWFTYDNDGNQQWILGTGQWTGEATPFSGQLPSQGFIFTDLHTARGARFGNEFDSDDVEREAWGELQLSLSCDLGWVHWDSLHSEFGSGGMNIQPLTRPQGVECGLPPVNVTIERTTYGVPHITADDYHSLGYGQGYAIAEDNLCVLADAFVTFRGQRSRYFGPDNRPAVPTTFGQPLNLDADFYFRFIVNDQAVADYRADQPRELVLLAEGFAAGYNRYVGEILNEEHEGRHAACRDAAWLNMIEGSDVFRRLIALNLAASGSNWVAEIANAGPAEQGVEADLSKPMDIDPQRFKLGRHHGLGSNMFAFGSDATGTDSGLSFANPHWFLDGIDRFYQQHLIIPGELNISGATIMGAPLVLIGFNDHIAWSHTVSTARRFGLYQLELVEGDPTRYVYDDEERELEAVEIGVPLADGEVVTRTLYRSHYGPMVDLSDLHPALAWNDERAFAMRDANFENRRSFTNFLEWDRSDSLQEFIDHKKALVAIPWVNTTAAGRDDPRAFYADITAVPNVPDALMADCLAQPFGPVFAQAAPGVPFLDGSRAECEWRTDEDSAQPGAFGPSNLPSLERTDYVANMNDSHWLSNPAEPLTGYARVIGGEEYAQTLRTRMGHVLAAERLAGEDGLEGNLATSETIREIVLNSRAMSAELLKGDLLAAACDGEPILVSQDIVLDLAFSPPLQIDVTEACTVLEAWDNTGNLDARGARIWEEFWRRASRLDAFAVAFDPADAIATPAVLNTEDPGILEALGAAVRYMTDDLELPLDAAVRDYQFYAKEGTEIPVYGGFGFAGYFTVLNRGSLSSGNNTYMHVVDFPEGEPVRAYTLLSHSQSADPASPHYADYTQAYSDKAWHRMPYTREQIDAQRISVLELKE